MSEIPELSREAASITASTRVEVTQSANRVKEPADQAAERAKSKVDSQDVSDRAARLKALGNVNLAITIDDSAELPVIKIFDNDTGAEIVQVPAEHSLNISRSIRAAVGAIFDQKA